MPAEDRSRPGALKAARILALLAAASGITAGVAAIAGGKEAIRQFVTDTVGGSLSGELFQTFIEKELESAYSLVVTKSSIAIAVAALVAVLALAVGSAKRSVRVLLAVLLIVNMVTSGLLGTETEVLPDLALFGAFLAVVLSIATVPFLFTRAVGRYGSRRAWKAKA
ncbi:hypothetical protein [Kribbella deserti]|uniref:Uncharacterized protein n=1 Tax=Kribbella deserti TaxID=1926257 RepID=A0ABV6QMZ6_9ACTN